MLLRAQQRSFTARGATNTPAAASAAAAINKSAVPSHPRRRRVSLAATTAAAAGRGFGGDAGSSAGGRKRNSNKSNSGGRPTTTTTDSGGRTAKIDSGSTVDAAVKQALGLERSSRGPAEAARPIDPREAARGRLDVATIADWGGAGGSSAGAAGAGSPKLSDLRVTSVTTRFDASADRPFSAQLAMLLQQLELQGALKIASGGEQLPPFEKWSFSRPRFLQFLSDAAAAHGGLEDALAAALAPPAAAGNKDAPGPSAGVAAALAALGPQSGLHRAACLRADLAVLLASPVPTATATDSSPQQQEQEQRQQQQQVQPTGGALALARHLHGLSATARSAAADIAERDRAALRLLAAAYSLLAAHHSLGVRVAAAAAESSGAAAAGALTAVTHYPGLAAAAGQGSAPAGADDDGRRRGSRPPSPAAALIAAVDAAGAALSAEQRGIVFDELPRAFPKAALLVAPLAGVD